LRPAAGIPDHGGWFPAATRTMPDHPWQVFRLSELARRVAGTEPRYFEFLRVPSLSCAMYRLPAGARDLQAPHLEDEVYFVIEGRGRLRTGAEQHEVGPGTVLFVRATSDHSFFDIEEDLTLVVVFGASRPLAG
jgi:mannose-6-phosphate isomerase-like protein (cupin superfamily)